jgi:mitogen-activated protein kinase kinase
MEVAQNRFPFPPENDSPLLPIELLQYIVNNPVEELKDEPERGVKWSNAFKHFLKRWYVLFKGKINLSLERDYHKRPSPKRLLDEHPWVVGMSKLDVDMERWIREVWQWYG